MSNDHVKICVAKILGICLGLIIISAIVLRIINIDLPEILVSLVWLIVIVLAAIAGIDLKKQYYKRRTNDDG